MRTTFAFGQWRGIPVRVHISLLLFVPFLAVILATRLEDLAALPGIRAEGFEDLGISFVERALIGFGVAISLFLSVLLHEMGHAWEAARHDVRTRDITLWIFGGVARLERLPDRPIVEAKVAIAGPLVSFALGFIGLFAGAFLLHPLPIFLVQYTGFLNLVLGTFNLIPAFPLDGGRVLRAWLAHRRGMVKGTATAASIGKVLAVALGLLGLVGGNLILVLIAGFIYWAGNQELAGVRARESLRSVRLAHITDTAGPPMPLDTTVEAGLVRMLQTRLTVLVVQAPTGDDAERDAALPATAHPERRGPTSDTDAPRRTPADPSTPSAEDAVPVQVTTEADLQQEELGLRVITMDAIGDVAPEDRGTTRLGQLPSHQVPLLPATATAAEALDALLLEGHPALFVTQGGRALGVVTREGLSRALAILQGTETR